MAAGAIALSVLLFALAGLMEIGGGWLVWQTFRDAKPWYWSAAGGLLLILYGIIPTLQDAHFGRVYAAYGGVFIALSLLWGWKIDGLRPDRFDVAGAVLCVAGAAVILYAPRAS